MNSPAPLGSEEEGELFSGRIVDLDFLPSRDRPQGEEQLDRQPQIDERQRGVRENATPYSNADAEENARAERSREMGRWLARLSLAYPLTQQGRSTFREWVSKDALDEPPKV